MTAAAATVTAATAVATAAATAATRAATSAAATSAAATSAATSGASTSEATSVVGSSGDPRAGRPARGRGLVRAADRHRRRLPARRRRRAGRPTSASWSATAPSRRRPAATTSATSTASRPSRTRRRSGASTPRLVLRDADGQPVVDEAWGECPARRTHRGQAEGARPDRRPLGARLRHARVRRGGVRQPRLVHPQRRAARPGARRSGTPRCSSTRRTPHGLAAGQKNLAGFDGTTIGYDFAVAEECGRYDECQRYVDDFGDQVLMIEYRTAGLRRTCTAYGATHAVELRDRDLTPDGVHGWC